MRSRTFRHLVTGLVATIALAACGGGDNTDDATASSATASSAAAATTVGSDSAPATPAATTEPPADTETTAVTTSPAIDTGDEATVAPPGGATTADYPPASAWSGETCSTDGNPHAAAVPEGELVAAVRAESTDSPIPDLAVRRVNCDPAIINLKNEFPADKPVLVWFWAPH